MTRRVKRTWKCEECGKEYNTKLEHVKKMPPVCDGWCVLEVCRKDDYTFTTDRHDYCSPRCLRRAVKRIKK